MAWGRVQGWGGWSTRECSPRGRQALCGSGPTHESPTALEQILNLRVQCEKEAKQDHLWKTKDPNFIDFEKSQQARAKAIEECQAYSGGDHKKKFQLVKDCLVLSFLTCQPYFN